MRTLVAIFVVIFVVGFIVCCGILGKIIWKLFRWAFEKGRRHYDYWYGA